MKNEELESKKRAIELWDTKAIEQIEVGTIKGLQQIHFYLFQDVFDFAGKIRTVNLSKRELPLCSNIIFRTKFENY